jgi:hypothetical protein
MLATTIFASCLALIGLFARSRLNFSTCDYVDDDDDDVDDDDGKVKINRGRKT